MEWLMSIENVFSCVESTTMRGSRVQMAEERVCHPRHGIFLPVMDTSLKKPLSLRISSQGSGLETAGNLCKGTEVSDVWLVTFSVGKKDTRKWHTSLSCQQSHAPRVSALTGVVLGYWAGSGPPHSSLPGARVWEPAVHIQQALLLKDSRNIWYGALNLVFINLKFKSVKLPTFLGCMLSTCGSWKILADAVTCQKWLTVEYGGVDIRLDYPKQKFREITVTFLGGFFLST